MIKVAAAIARLEGKLLVTRRAPGQKLAGFWEFPGGKLEPGETVQTCIARELAEELGVRCTPGDVITSSDYNYPGGAIRLLAIEVELQSTNFQLDVHDEYAWVAPGELLDLNLAPADIPIAIALQVAQNEETRA